MVAGTDALGMQWHGDLLRSQGRSPDTEKRAARIALNAARRAREAGRPGGHFAHLRAAAVSRSNAQDLLGIAPTAPQSVLGSSRSGGGNNFLRNDIKATRRLP